MNFHGLIHTFSKDIKWFIGVFIFVLSVGYYTGLLFVNQTSTMQASGIEENYLGNEDDEDAKVMKFKKGSREMLTIIHTHILSMSFIFFLLGGILATTSVNKRLKHFLMIEPLISVVITFGGIYLLWTGMLWMKYIIILSGTLMTASYTVSVLLIIWQLCIKKKV